MQWVEEHPSHTTFSANAIMEELVAKKNARSPIYNYFGFKPDTKDKLNLLFVTTKMISSPC